MWRQALLSAGLAASLIAAGPAQAMTRKQADRVAVRALKPPRGDVLFRLPKPVPKGSAVIEWGADRKNVRPLGGRTWVYWLDQEPGARFDHPSVMLLIDDRRRRVIRRQRMARWPGILRRGSRRVAQPPWITNPATYRRAIARAAGSARAAVRDPFAGDPVARMSQAPVVNEASFREDCLIQIGDRTDPKFQGDFRAMAGWAASVGLRHQRVDGALDLNSAVGTEIAGGCKDVFLQISGHGKRPFGYKRDGEPEEARGTRGPPTVWVHEAMRSENEDGTFDVVYTEESLTLPFLDDMIKLYKDTTFKIKIDACYAGRFAALDENPNVLVLELSSGSEEVSYSDLSLPEDKTTNPEHAGEFTNGNVAGLQRWSTSADEVREHGGRLYQGITRSFELGKDQDFARTSGRTHPELYTNPPPESAPPPPPAGTARVALASPGYSHKTPGDPPQQYPSSVCSDIESNRPGATASVSMSPPQGQQPKSVVLDASGRGYVKFGIQQPDTDYTLTVTLDGASDSETVHAGPYPPADESRPCP